MKKHIIIILTIYLLIISCTNFVFAQNTAEEKTTQLLNNQEDNINPYNENQSLKEHKNEKQNTLFDYETGNELSPLGLLILTFGGLLLIKYMRD